MKALALPVARGNSKHSLHIVVPTRYNVRMSRKCFPQTLCAFFGALVLLLDSGPAFAADKKAIDKRNSAKATLRQEAARPQDLVRRILALAPDLPSQVAQRALRAARCAGTKLHEPSPDKLAIVDYSLPSTEKRFWMFDLANTRLLAREYVAHGKNTGLNEAKTFSNIPGSLQSSLGLYRVGERYVGKHGDSLKLIGLEKGINDNAEERAIVIHGADYVSPEFLSLHQRLGRSWGCPAVSQDAIKKVIDYFKSGEGFLFVYYPDREWLDSSQLQDGC